MHWRSTLRGLILMALLVPAMCLSSPTAHAEAPQFELLGHRLGEAYSLVVNNAAFDCSATARPAFDHGCRAKRPADMRLGEVGMDSLVLHFSGDALAAVEAHFQEARFEDVLRALQLQYGESQATPERLRGGMGGFFEDAVHLWRQDRTLVRLEQFDVSISTSQLILTSEDQIADVVTPKRIDPKSGLKDL